MFSHDSGIKAAKAGLVALMIGSLPVAHGVMAAENAASATPTTQAVQAEKKEQKTEKLVNHISRTYQVRPATADLVVREAIQHAEKRDLEPELVLAVIATESTFRPEAVSRAGARGLMQVIPRYHRTKVKAVGGTPALFDPAKNIQVGTKILNEYIAMSGGNVRNGLLRYNGSLGRSTRYARRVFRHYHRMKEVSA